MPRRQFLDDLKSTLQSPLPAGVENLERGEDDGQINFRFKHETEAAIDITALVSDISDYPKQHKYMLFAAENASASLAAQLQKVGDTDGKSVNHMLDLVSKCLSSTPAEDAENLTQADNDSDLLSGSEDDDFDVSDTDSDTFIGRSRHDSIAHQILLGRSSSVDMFTALHKKRLYHDLCAARAAGFKVSSVGRIIECGPAFISLSIRIAKLGISEDAMEAWQVVPNDYLILLIHYKHQYLPYEELQAAMASGPLSLIKLRIRASKSYKPTLKEAIDAFRDPNDLKTELDRLAQPVAHDGNTDGLRTTFISTPLETMFEESLLQVLRFRSCGMSWRGAEDWHRELQNSTSVSNHNAIPDKHFLPEPVDANLPLIVVADHFTSSTTSELSFPLLAMQYALRHFVRCTEFCLVCHRHLSTSIEAIKPYVCDEPLCLYQYMTLGFGPRIEHEITTQPKVVDLLISFCFDAATSRKLRDFPVGLSLMVPPIPVTILQPSNHNYDSAWRSNTNSRGVETLDNIEGKLPKWSVGYDEMAHEMIFFDQPASCPVRAGSWIVLTPADPLHATHRYHCKVLDSTYFPTISLGEAIKVDLSEPDTADKTDKKVSDPIPPTKASDATRKWIDFTFQLYDRDFDAFNDFDKCETVRTLLTTLPSVESMKTYIERHPSSNLSKWRDRLSPPTLSLLRWIIASNRACIVEVAETGDTPRKNSASEQVHGMAGYTQFRFAMGARDKEHRFVTAVRETSRRLDLAHPTMFAWHGSPLHNWHSIIREGLHFKETAHGRAYGDGVYHARDIATSNGYTHRHTNTARGDWPSSVLKPRQVVALNEIVNARSEFISSSPYYVVSQLDWIQTRYLFVQTGIAPSTEASVGRPQSAYPQDPAATALGVANTAVVIPAGAIKWKRALCGHDTPRNLDGNLSPKRLKTHQTTNTGSLKQNDWDNDSVATDAEDAALFDSLSDRPTDGRFPDIAEQRGDSFRPSPLDVSKIPLMPCPENATSSSTQRLMRELQKLQNIQQSTSLNDLGWYIDADKVENAYQWLVELHSFDQIDSNLPLVADMKRKAIPSILMELRFQHDFPFSPPYVRVIRPRFLTLMAGGGGHIVMGGAMCMQLLTNSGWSPASSMESVLMQIRLAIASDPPARIDFNRKDDYGVAEAAEGYIRACQSHGWTVPPGFKNMALGITERE